MMCAMPAHAMPYILLDTDNSLIVDASANSALHIAARSGSVTEVKSWLEDGTDPNEQNDFWQTPLHSAVKSNCIDCIELLLEYGANPNIRDINGKTPLYVAAKRGSLDAMHVLMMKGANPDIKDTGGQTSIAIARRRFTPEDIKALLWFTDMVNPSERYNGNTPLHIAARYGTIDQMHNLLEAGADPTVRNVNGLTPHEFLNNFPLMHEDKSKFKELRSKSLLLLKYTPQLPTLLDVDDEDEDEDDDSDFSSRLYEDTITLDILKKRNTDRPDYGLFEDINQSKRDTLRSPDMDSIEQDFDSFFNDTDKEPSMNFIDCATRKESDAGQLCSIVSIVQKIS